MYELAPVEIMGYNDYKTNFGKKPKRRTSLKEHIGWCVKKGRIVKVYKYKGLTGKRFSDKKKLPKGRRVYKTKQAAQNARKRTTRTKTEKIYVYYKKPKFSRTGYLRNTSCSGRTNEGDCGSKPGCEWTGNSCRKAEGVYQGPVNRQGFGLIPANRYNYQLQQYATNEGTPTMQQLGRIGQIPSWSYPTYMNNSAWFVPRNNLSGYGF